MRWPRDKPVFIWPQWRWLHKRPRRYRKEREGFSGRWRGAEDDPQPDRGHFGPDGTVAKPLDIRILRRLLDELGEVDSSGSPTLGGWKVRFEDGCVILPWKGGATNRAAEDFAIRLQQETGCALQDQEHGRMFQAGELGAERKGAG